MYVPSESVRHRLWLECPFSTLTAPSPRSSRLSRGSPLVSEYTPCTPSSPTDPVS